MRKLRSMAEFTQQFPDVKEVIVDGTERPVQRPQNRERQKEYYSGKKKLSQDSWYSPKFGHRLPRSVLTTQGISSHSVTLLCTILTSNSAYEFTTHGGPDNGWISRDGVPLFKWSIKSQMPTVEFL